jgi:hypothetical protein
MLLEEGDIISWQHQPSTDTIWENVEASKKKYPDIMRCFSGRGVMLSIPSLASSTTAEGKL